MPLEEFVVMVDLQKASMWKRVAAWMLDIILITILATGVGVLLSSVMKYDDYVEELNQTYARYEAEYGVKFNLSQEEYDAMTQEELAIYENAYEALTKDEKMNATYNMVVHQTLLMVSLGILVSVLLLEFVVPLLLKNGQTIGKKAFGIGLMRTDYVKVNTMQLFVRAILGKYTIEIMFPVYLMLLSFLGALGLVGTLVVAGLLLTEIILLAATRNNSQIHDILAGTVVIDLTSQKIFESQEARTEYSKRIHADMVAKKEY